MGLRELQRRLQGTILDSLLPDSFYFSNFEMYTLATF